MSESRRNTAQKTSDWKSEKHSSNTNTTVVYNLELARRETATREGKTLAGPLFREKKCFMVGSEGVRLGRVAFGEEWEGHSLWRDWRQKRHGNHQWKVWNEESGGWEYRKQSGEYGRGRYVKFEAVTEIHKDTQERPFKSFKRDTQEYTGKAS